MIGGLEIKVAIPCTLGFNVMNWDTGIDPYTSTHYFFTAGHCTPTPGIPSGYDAHQVSLLAPQDKVGAEYQVVPRRSGASCPVNKSPCMDADVLVVRYDSTVTFPDSVRYGWVANVNASKTIITPWFNVQGTISGGLNGQTVTTVGMTSGKSTGVISAICVDQLLGTSPNIWILCQDRANYVASGGDSGAPVFIPYSSGNPMTPSIVGIHSSSAGSYRWFSSINMVMYGLYPTPYFYQ